ncbi:MAG: calcium-binding protein, partial [Pseudomonadota bacterium]
ITDVLEDMAGGIRSAVDAIDVSSLGVAGIQDAVDDVLAPFESLAGLGELVGDYFTLADAFTFDVDANLTDLGNLLGLNRDFEASDAGDREALRQELNARNGTSIDSIDEDEVSSFNVEIFSLLDADFDVADWLSPLSDLLGIDAALSFDDVRLEAQNFFKSAASIRGLLDYVTTLLPDEIGGDAGGFSFGVDIDNRVLDLGLALNPTFETSIADIVGALTDLIAGASADVGGIGDVLGGGRVDENGVFSADLDDLVTGINLLADFAFDISARVDLSDFSNFSINDDVTINVNELTAGLDVVGEDLDFGVSIGGLALGIENANLGLGIDVEMLGLADTASGSFFAGTLADFRSVISGLDTLVPSLFGDYFAELPFSLVISGPGGDIDFGDYVQPIFSIEDSFEYTYDTNAFVTVDGLDPAIALGLGVNLGNTIGEPLDALLDEVTEQGITSYKLPLVNQSLEDILRVESFLNNVVAAFQALPLLTVSLERAGNGDLSIDIDQGFLDSFNEQFTDVLKTAISDLLRVPQDSVVGDGLLVSYTGGELGFALDLGLAIDAGVEIGIDLAELISNFTGGFDPTDFLQLEASANLGIRGSADFGFDFNYKLEDQLFGTLVGDALVLNDAGFALSLDQFGADDINARAGIDVPQEFIDSIGNDDVEAIIERLEELAQIAIEGGSASFLVENPNFDPANPDAEPRFLDLFSFVYDGTSWDPSLNAGFTVDLPVFVADGLRLQWTEDDGMGGEISYDSISLTGAFSGTDLSTFSIDPPALPEVSQIGDQIKLMLLINSPAYLVSAVDQVASLFDRDDPDSIFNRLLYGDGGLSEKLQELEIPLVGDIVSDVAEALEGVVNEVIDGFSTVLMGIAAGLEAIGIDENTTLDELIQGAIAEMFGAIESAIQSVLDSLGLDVTVPALLTNLNFQDLGEFLGDNGTSTDAFDTWLSDEGQDDFGAIGDAEFDQLLEDFLLSLGIVETIPAGIAKGMDINRSSNYVRVSEEDLAEGRLEFEFQIGLTLFDKSVDIDFEAAVPGLALELEEGSQVNFSSDLTLDLGFGFDVTATSIGDFMYVATDKGGVFENPAEDYGEFKFTLGADLGDSFEAMAELGFLQAAVGYDLNAPDNAGIDGFGQTFLEGAIIVDLVDSTVDEDGEIDEQLSLSDLGSFSVQDNLLGVAQIAAQSDLRARLGLGTQLGDIDYSGDLQNFDGIDGLIVGGGVDVHYQQQYGRSLFGGDPGFENGAELIFENLHLDVGFLAELIAPVLDAINEYIAPPIDAIAELLEIEVALLGDIGLVPGDNYSGTAIGDPNTTELVDVLVLVADILSAVPDPRARAAGTAIDALVQLVGVGKSIVDIAAQLGDVADQGILNFGTIRIGDKLTSDQDLIDMLGIGSLDEIFDIDAAVAPDSDGNETSDADLQAALDQGLNRADSPFNDNPNNPNNDLNLPSTRPEVEVQFNVTLPILESPMSALNLVLGKPTDIVNFAFDFSLEFGAETKVPLAGPLSALFDLGFGLGADIDIGFNTRGIADTLQGLTVGEFPDDPGVLLDGLLEGVYFDDHIVNGVDQPEIFVDAKLLAGLSAGIPGLVEASVYGGVTGELNIDWADNPANTDTIGRFYLDELIDTVSQRGLECIFDIDGSLDAELGWSVWVGLDAGFFTVTIFEDSDVFLRENIVTFIHTCNVKSPALASLDADGELRLNIGDRASFRASEQFQPDGLPAGTNFVDYDPNDPEYAGTIRSTDANYAVAYKVTEDMHDFQDGLGDVDAIVVESEGIKQYFRKADVNKISGAGRGVQTVFDVDGNPIGTRGDLIVLDLDAPDIEVDISGGNEADQIRVDGVYDSVTIDGGGGNDVLVAAGLTDAQAVTLIGGSGNDQIAGSQIGDLIIGGVGDDIISGGLGDDVIWGFNENNSGSLGNQTDRDKIRGDEGADSINAGPQNDVVSWVKGDGSDLLVTGGDSAEQDALSLVGYDVDADAGDADSVTLSRANTDIVLDWSDLNGQEGFTFSNFASISLDVGAGTDSVVVDDLSNTTVGAVNVDLGGTSSLSAESVFLDADGNVIRYTDNVPALYRADVFETYAEDTFREQSNGDWISSDQVTYLEIDRKRYRFDDVEQDYVEDDDGDFYRTVDDVYIEVAGQTRYLRFLTGEVILDADGNKTLLHATGDPILDENGVPVIQHFAGDIVLDEIQARRIAAGDLNGTLEAEVTGETRLVSSRSSDGDADSLTFIGSDQADGIELFSKRNLVFGDIDYGLQWNGVVDNPGLSEDFVLNLAQLDAFDSFVVDAGAGDDVIDARDLQNVIPTNVDSRVGDDGEPDPDANPASTIDLPLLLLTLYGNTGDDRILGSELAETIVGGRGADTIFGNAGVDIYQSPLFPETGALIHEHVNGELIVDTLVAQRDADFKLTDTELHIGDGEVENLANLFEAVVLVGGEGNNTFTIGRIGDTQTPTDVWRYDLVLDGGAGADVYDVWLSGFGRPAGIFDTDPAAEIRLLDGGSNTGPDGQSIFDELGLNDESLMILGGGAGLVYRGGKDQGLDLRTDVLTINAADQDDAFHFDAVDRNGRELAGYNADGKQVDANGDLLDLDGFVERIDAANDLAAVFQSINADEIAENLDTVDDSIANPDVRGVSVSGDVLRQRVYYNSAEQVIVHGWGGNDLFIVDNNTEQLKVYGDVGEDSFFIGNVKRTVAWTPPGQDTPIDIIDGETGISDGVTVQSEFFGGEQDDYFEVNRNRGRMSLYGNNGDDTFFLRAHLIGDGTEIESEKISASAGDENGEVADSDNDALVNYLRNNEVDIIGGGGFDTLIVSGTALADDFYVFTEVVDGVEVQRIFGAGLAVSRIDSVERLMILTAGGDDNVYLYGTLPGQELLINTGGGDDTIFVGGDTQAFQVEIPAATNVEVVPLFEQVRTFADSFVATNFFDYYEPIKGYERFISDFRVPVGETALPREVLEEWFDFFGQFWYFSAISWHYTVQFINLGFDNFVDFYSDVIRSRFYGEPDTVALNAAFTEFTELNLIEPFPQYNIELPAFTLDITANTVRDLGTLAGPVRLTDISGNDRVIIDNSLADDGAENLLLAERLIEKAEFTVEEDAGVLAGLFADDERFTSGYIDASELAGSLLSQIRRDNQVKNPGIVTRMLDGGGSESVSLAAGQKIYEFDSEADVLAYLSQFTELPPDTNSALNSAVTVYQPVPAYRPEDLAAVYEYGWETPPLEYTRTDPNSELLSITVTDTSTNTIVAVFTTDGAGSADEKYENWRRSPATQIEPSVNYYTYSRVENGVVQISWVYQRSSLFDENGQPAGFEDELLVEFRADNFADAASAAGLNVAFDEAGIEAYMTTVYGVEVRPQADVQIDPPEWPKRFEATVADSSGDRFQIEVVGFANAAAPDVIVGWSVYALDVLTLDVPDEFVTGRAVDSNGVEIPWIYTPQDTIFYDYDDGSVAEQRNLYYAGFESLEINFGDTDNEVLVESTSYLEDMIINTGGGSDVVRFGDVIGEDADGEDIESLAGIQADIVVDTGNDAVSTDIVIVSAANNENELDGQISEQLITGFELGGGITYRNTDYLDVTTGSAADDVTVTATHEEVITFVNTGDSDDIVLLSSAENSTDLIEGELRIDVGSGGDNRLLVVDTGDLTGDTIGLDIEADVSSPLDGSRELFGRIAGMSPGLIYYRGDEESAFQAGDGIVVRTSSGDDEVAVRNLYRGNLTELYVGIGDDSVVVDGFSLDGRAADLPELTVYGGTGDDYVDASAAPIGVTLYGNLPDLDVAADESDDD